MLTRAQLLWGLSISCRSMHVHFTSVRPEFLLGFVSAIIFSYLDMSPPETGKQHPWPWHLLPFVRLQAMVTPIHRSCPLISFRWNGLSNSNLHLATVSIFFYVLHKHWAGLSKLSAIDPICPLTKNTFPNSWEHYLGPVFCRYQTFQKKASFLAPQFKSAAIQNRPKWYNQYWLNNLTLCGVVMHAFGAFARSFCSIFCLLTTAFYG